MTTKKKRELFRTPEGVAIYPRLNKPDFKYKKENGEYSVKLKLTAEDAAPLKKLITEATEKDYKLACLREEKPKLKHSPNIPFKDEENDQGELTGSVIFTFKCPGKVMSKKTGEIFEMKPALFHKNGEVVTEEIWGGSTIKVASELRPYYTEGLGHGMTLSLKAVQVVKLVSRGQGSAEQYGFEVESESEPEADDSAEEGEADGKADAKGDF